ncbi:MAG: phosphatase PAP2 family protein [Pseudomonadota bacterium]
MTILKASFAATLLLGLACTAVRADTADAGEAVLIGLGASALYGAFIHEEGTEGRWQLLKSVALSEVVTEALKTAIDKERPNGSCCTAFPSGHASKSFTAAHFLQRRYGWKAGGWAYAAATFVAYTRVESDRHDEVDVIGGALIGVLSSHLFTNRYVEVSPMIEGDVVGLTASIRF